MFIIFGSIILLNILCTVYYKRNVHNVKYYNIIILLLLL